MLKDETFNPGALTKGSVITLPEGMDMVSMPVSVSTAVAGFVGPGSKVDVLATLRLGNQLRAFPLLVDMLVLAVDQHVSYDTAKGDSGVFPSMSNVSFAATQEQALLLALAQQRGCHMQLLLRHPGKPLDKDYDIKKIKQLLEDQKNPTLLKKTEEASDPEEPVFPRTPIEACAKPEDRDGEGVDGEGQYRARYRNHQGPGRAQAGGVGDSKGGGQGRLQRPQRFDQTELDAQDRLVGRPVGDILTGWSTGLEGTAAG